MKFSITQGITILAAGLVFFALVLVDKNAKVSPVPDVPPHVEVQEPENDEIIDTSDWVEYRNDEYGFAVKYPPDWDIGSVTPDSRPENVRFSQTTREAGKYLNDMSITILVDANPSGVAPTKQWYREWELQIPAGLFIDESEINMTSFMGLQALMVGQTIFFAKGSSMFRISWNVAGDFEGQPAVENEKLLIQAEETFNQILSTFEFFEPVAEIDKSDWIEYRSDKFGFLLRLPPNWVVEDELPDDEVVSFVSRTTIRRGEEFEEQCAGSVSEECWDEYIVSEQFSFLERDEGFLDGIADHQLTIALKTITIGKHEWSKWEASGFEIYTHWAIPTKDGKVLEYINVREPGLVQEILSTFEFIEPANSESNERVVLTPELYEKINRELNWPEDGDVLCDEEFLGGEPTTNAVYTDAGRGLQFDVPYNPAWGSATYQLEPYDIDEDGDLSFGAMHMGEGCGWFRINFLLFRDVRTVDEVMSAANENNPYGGFIVEPYTIELGDMQAVFFSRTNGFCSTSPLEVIGEKHNYILGQPCGEKLTLSSLRAIAETFEFID